ncbi:MAG TPA: hypothetical protein VFD30_09460 [Terriglobia bacterium]|nr:hypothetical protein [Terriglobia bacterium]
MFQMVGEEEKNTPQDRTMLLYKVLLIFVALGACGGVLYFFAFGK